MVATIVGPCGPHAFTTREEAVLQLLSTIPGEDYGREGLVDTPRRVAQAWQEFTSGYGLDPVQVLGTQFKEPTDQIICLRGIRFTSMCEHHLLPFTGQAVVTYLPGPRIVGISKLARLVECYAKRIQIQERITRQVAEAIMEHLEAQGAGVVLKAHHMCMGCRGVRQVDAEMVTSCMLGVFRDDTAARAEVMRLASS